MAESKASASRGAPISWPEPIAAPGTSPASGQPFQACAGTKQRPCRCRTRHRPTRRAVFAPRKPDRQTLSGVPRLIASERAQKQFSPKGRSLSLEQARVSTEPKELPRRHERIVRRHVRNHQLPAIGASSSQRQGQVWKQSPSAWRALPPMARVEFRRAFGSLEECNLALETGDRLQVRAGWICLTGTLAEVCRELGEAANHFFLARNEP